MAMDTGATHTIIGSDVVDDIGLGFEIGAPINRSFGVGGTDYALEKTVGSLEFGGVQMTSKQLDFGQINRDINGLVGLDILIPGRFVIDLDSMELTTKKG